MNDKNNLPTAQQILIEPQFSNLITTFSSLKDQVEQADGNAIKLEIYLLLLQISLRLAYYSEGEQFTQQLEELFASSVDTNREKYLYFCELQSKLLCDMGKLEQSFNLINQSIEKAQEDNSSFNQEIEYYNLLELKLCVQCKLGNLQNLKDEFKSILQAKAKILEDNIEMIYKTQYRLGLILEEFGDYNEARANYKLSKENAIKLFDENHPEILNIKDRSAMLFIKEKQYGQAMKLLEEIIQLRKDAFSVVPNHPDIAESLSSYGLCLHRVLKSDEGKKYLENALEIRVKAYGETHYVVAENYNYLARALINCQQKDLALEKHKKSLQIYTDNYNLYFPGRASSENNIGLFYLDKDEPVSALEHTKRALEIRQKIYGDLHTVVGDSYNNVGMIYAHKKDIETALQYYEKCLKIRQLANSPFAGDTYFNIALLKGDGKQIKLLLNIQRGKKLKENKE